MPEHGYECMQSKLIITPSLSTSFSSFNLDLDHTADIQVHSWGINLEEAFVNTSHAMLDYMYERESVKEEMEANIEVEGILE